jgi:hypothetical protein
MSTPNPKFNGLTDDQVLMVLNQVATTIDLMAKLCRQSCALHDGDAAGLTFYALDNMLSSTGAMTDLATGGNIGGDFAEWMMGPDFHAAQA